MRWSRRLLGRALLTAALSAGAALGLVSSAAASPPQPVHIQNTIVPDPQAQCGVEPGYTITFSATGGVFGSGVSGTDCVVSAHGSKLPKSFQHSIVGTIHRVDVYTDGSGTFTLDIQKVGRLLQGPPGDCPPSAVTVPGDQCSTIVYKGHATVKGGTGAYTNLRGTLDFTSTELFDLNPSVFETVSATEDLVGSLHIDPQP